MRHPHLLTIALALLTLSASAQDATTKQHIQNNIHWTFNEGGSNMPTQWHSWIYPVLIGDGSVAAWRGPVSAHNCGAIAAAYALAGKDEAALSWLCAAQSHNQPVCDQYRAYPAYTIAHLKASYRDQGLALIGLGPQVTAGAQILSNVKQWMGSNHADPTPPNDALEPKPEPRQHDRDPGGAGRYK